MTKRFRPAYGVGAYLLFLVSFCYAIAFVGGFVVPRTVDHGIGDGCPSSAAIAINTLLLGIFAVQTQRDGPALVQTAGGRGSYRSPRTQHLRGAGQPALLLLYWQWRTMPAVVWHVEAPAIRALLWVVFWLGWATVLAATFMIDHFELFGLSGRSPLARNRPAGNGFPRHDALSSGAPPADARVPGRLWRPPP